MVMQRTPQWTPQMAGKKGFKPSYILAGVAIAVAGAYLLGRK